MLTFDFVFSKSQGSKKLSFIVMWWGGGVHGSHNVARRRFLTEIYVSLFWNWAFVSVIPVPKSETMVYRAANDVRDSE